MALFTKRTTKTGVVRTFRNGNDTTRSVVKRGARRHGEKAGTALKQRIRNIPLVGSLAGGCASCSNLAKEMDRNGCDWCEQHFDQIVRKIKGNHVIARVTPAGVIERYVREAIDSARHTAKRRQQKPPRGGQVKVTPEMPSSPIPLDNPRLTLMFHVYPHGESWRYHLEKLRPHLHRFDRLMLGIAHDPTTSSTGETVAAFTHLDDRWEIYLAVNEQTRRGKQGLREVATYLKMLPDLHTTPDDVTFCLHAKGIQPHVSNNDAIRWWIDAMYSTVYSNIDGVIAAMRNGASIVGSFRKHCPMFKSRYKWHFSGTYYAFRNCVAFSRGVPQYRRIWFGTESWPGDYFPIEASHCIFGDHTQDLYKVQEQPRTELDRWKEAKNGPVSAG